METKYLSLQDLLKNEETAKKLFVLDVEECSVVLKKEYNLDFSVEELNEFMRGLQAALKDRKDGELDESDLDMVSGGRDNSAYGYGYSFGRFVPAVVVVCVAASAW